MDISNLTSSYTDLYSGMASTSGVEKTLKEDPASLDDKKLMDACKQFESYFLEQVFKEMQKTVHPGDGSKKNSLMEYFEDQYVQKIAEDSTEQNSLGLAQMLYDQMKRNYGTAADSLNISAVNAVAENISAGAVAESILAGNTSSGNAAQEDAQRVEASGAATGNPGV